MAERNPRKEDCNTIIETNTNEEIENNTFSWGPKVQDCKRINVEQIASNPIAKEGWSVPDFSSEASGGAEGTNGYANLIIDGDESTYWHSQWNYHSAGDAELPHWLVVDVGSLMNFRILQILQSQPNSSYDRKMRHLKVEISSASAYSATDADMNWQTIYDQDTPVQLRFNIDFGQTYQARFIRMTIVAVPGSGETNFKRINEIYLFRSAEDLGTYPVYELNHYQTAYKSKRVLTQPFPYYEGTRIGGNRDDNNMEYKNAAINPFDVMTSWDGFPINVTAELVWPYVRMAAS